MSLDLQPSPPAVRTTTARKLEKYPALEAHDLGGGRTLELFATGAYRYRWRVIERGAAEPVSLAASPAWHATLDECRERTRWLRPRRWLRRGLAVANLAAVIIVALVLLG